MSISLVGLFFISFSVSWSGSFLSSPVMQSWIHLNHLVRSIRIAKTGAVISKEATNDLSLLLRPGDIILERLDGNLTNLLVDGYFSHVFLVLGSRKQMEALSLEAGETWEWPKPVLDAFFRFGEDTLVIEAIPPAIRISSLNRKKSSTLLVLRPFLDSLQSFEKLKMALSLYGFGYNYHYRPSVKKLTCIEMIAEIYPEFSLQSPRPLVPDDLIYKFFGKNKEQFSLRLQPVARLRSKRLMNSTQTNLWIQELY